MKKIFLPLLLSSMLLARYEATPMKVCGAFNNMKHTKNTQNIYLDTSKSYTVLKTHKGQHLILLKGITPAQRWVDEGCLSSKRGKKSFEIKQNLLALSWHNAFCETHHYKKECRVSTPYSATHFVLHGLWPQPKNNQYCGVSKKRIGIDKNKQWSSLPPLDLTKKTRKSLLKVMPGMASNLHRHEWIKHGTCYQKNAQAYYTDAIALTMQLNDSFVGNYFSKNIGKKIHLKEVKEVFEKAFGKGVANQIELRCKKGLISELWLHLGHKRESKNINLSSLLQRGKKIKSRCQSGRLDRVGFGR